MAIYVYWGEDSFAIAQAVKTLQEKTLDPTWESFNVDKISPDQPDAVIQGLNQAMTPPFGAGDRFVWLVETTLAQRCSESLLAELERTLPAILKTTTLLLTSSSKPDGRLKSTKLLQKYASIQEFSPIPPWKTDLLIKQVQQVARELEVKLNADSAEFLAEAIGNNTRQLYSDLEKIRLLGGESKKPLTVDEIAPLITASTQNSLQLVAAILEGKTDRALELVTELLRQNEPALKILATLIGQFRQRLWIKVMLESGERDDRTIAQAAELNNPKKLYFLQKELAKISVTQLQQTLPLLLELEFSLKRGAEEISTLQTKAIELCQIFKT
ncbi:DNA polymerase III subunit delta [Phormidesmis priestleyi ULC007]|uniref:DNA polymerase III subunit delta n=1 Tax=Phormidesmis priestleyi ULC007 TaxID=1920490 RepID=A0A2T1DKC9_9CYAN|nr:DNA polymerase III subunit delta [Phormidesmis priestleyi]PSB20884.1 DNA polymerase III subunit delta [Phormidesmis priestleyi ULC007]PZO51839.1 MAG: DNA polymerase III subunit delta [Phormidesmis priestleyi]